MQNRLGPLVLLFAFAAASPGQAQSDAFAAAHVASANQLGILEYCQSRGDVGDDAVSAQKSAMTHLPASTISTDAAENLGKQGTLSAPNGASMTLASIASTHNTTVSALCKQMGGSAIQSAATYAQVGRQTGGMPSMSAMPSMPKLPSMSGMPAMGNMPAMPAVPSGQ